MLAQIMGDQQKVGCVGGRAIEAELTFSARHNMRRDWLLPELGVFVC